jgi:predicted MPP superfamily phosphohydrolase
LDIEKDIKTFALAYCHDRDYMQDRLQEYFQEYFEDLISIDDVELYYFKTINLTEFYSYKIHSKDILLTQDEFIAYLKDIYQPIELKRKIENVHSAPSLE